MGFGEMKGIIRSGEHASSYSILTCSFLASAQMPMVTKKPLIEPIGRPRIVPCKMRSSE